MPIDRGKITLHYTLIFELKKIVEINKLDNLMGEEQSETVYVPLTISQLMKESPSAEL